MRTVTVDGIVDFIHFVIVFIDLENSLRYLAQISAETGTGKSQKCHNDEQHYQRQAEEDRGAASVRSSGETEGGAHPQEPRTRDEDAGQHHKTGLSTFLSKQSVQ